ncbi:MAG: glycosyl hydrolase, partial [Bacteroidota bacterium]
KSVIKGAPHAIGLNRALDAEQAPFAAFSWGLTHKYQTDDYQYIRGFRGLQVSAHVAKGEAGSDQRTANTFEG